MRRRKKFYKQEAELDITSFMNLMIILVPVLLLSMVFARTTVVDLKLPDLSASSEVLESDENLVLEVVIRPDYLDVNYPAGTLLKRLPKIDAESEQIGEQSDEPVGVSALEASVIDTGNELEKVHDYELLSLVLQEVKRQLAEKGMDKRDILLLSEPDTSYQTLISAMDSIRSYKALVVTDVVDAVLFPDISLGDAPAAFDHAAKVVALDSSAAVAALDSSAAVAALNDSAAVAALNSSAAVAAGTF